jgi:DNA-binding beta-propeller fold protein YncE
VEGTQSQDITAILADPVRNRIYYADGTTNKIFIIQAATESIIGTIALQQKPVAIDISKDGAMMAIAHGNISLVDLDTLQTVSVFNINKTVMDVAFDHAGRLYATTADDSGKIHIVDSVSGAIIFSFAPHGSIYQGALVETDQTGNFLYAAERGLSPASTYKYDISGSTPVFLAEDDHGAIGGNLKDITVHPNGSYIYLACGAPYSIQEVNAETIDVVNLFAIGAYPSAVAVNRAGTVIYAGTYGSSDNTYLYKFDFSTKSQAAKIPLLELSGDADILARGIAIDRTGSKVFAVTGGDYYAGGNWFTHWQIQVMSEWPLSDSDGDGIADVLDNCPQTANPQQRDADADGIGDVCDTTPACGGCGQAACETVDTDNDGIADSADNCPSTCNPQQRDADADSIGDACDTTPACGGCGQPACEAVCLP